MVQIECELCGNFWEGNEGDVDCPECGGTEYITRAGDTINIKSMGDLINEIEKIEHDLNKSLDDRTDAQEIIDAQTTELNVINSVIDDCNDDITDLNGKRENLELILNS